MPLIAKCQHAVAGILNECKYKIPSNFPADLLYLMPILHYVKGLLQYGVREKAGVRGFRQTA